MAVWQRDPKLRRRLIYLLAAAEAAALTVNFYFLCLAYLHRFFIYLGRWLQTPPASPSALWVVGLVLTLGVLGLAAYEAVLYVRERPWVRKALIAQNAGLVALGGVWFVLNRLHGATPDPYAATLGLLLPMVTLFPLLWPLLTIHPAAVGGTGTPGRP